MPKHSRGRQALYFGICDNCDYEWEESYRNKVCPNCGMTDIAMWKDTNNRSVPKRRLSDAK